MGAVSWHLVAACAIAAQRRLIAELGAEERRRLVDASFLEIVFFFYKIQ